MDDLNCDLSQAETWLRVTFRQITRLPWAEYGHEVAQAEFRLDENTTFLPMPLVRSLQYPKIQAEGRVLQVSSPTFALTFDKIQAKVLKWNYKGLDIISQDAGPQLTFWRAPTDNDKGRAAGEWRGYGLNSMTQEVRSVEYRMTKDSTAVMEIVIKSWNAPPILAWGFETTTTYTIHGDGKLLIHVRALPKGSSPSTLPRVGLEMMLPEDRTYAQWLGLGPGPTYRDMKEAGTVGLWKRSLDDMMINYEMPQENGNRTETRWVKVVNEKGIGIRAVLKRHNSSDTPKQSPSDILRAKSEKRISPLNAWEMVHRPHQESNTRPGFDFAVSKYTAADLDQAQHPYELRGSKGVVFRIDDEHYGLGTASCGPDTLEQHQLKLREFDFSVSLEATGL